MQYLIVAVGYNRPDSMRRLLISLLEADYENDKVDLIVSIDKGQLQEEIVAVAESFRWRHGNKAIRKFETRQGLRMHILQCGDLSEEYDAVIVLEDDITVAPNFYRYAKQAADFYIDDKRIAGISLYKHLINPGLGRPFEPACNGFDTYMMQVAQSWGQCWTRSMWQDFRKWYDRNDDDITSDEKIPDYIVHWNKHSWLKYYNRYIIETDRYFIYPYVSLSTNYSEAGEHCKYENNDYQVQVLEGIMDYRFPTFNCAVRYDAFFERMGLDDKIFSDIHGKKLLDLYGGRTKYGDADVLISTNKLPYKVIREIALRYRPAEVNYFKPEPGKGIYVYDLHLPKRNNSKYDIYDTTRYDVRAIHWKRTLQHGIRGFRDAILSRIFRKLKL